MFQANLNIRRLISYYFSAAFLPYCLLVSVCAAVLYLRYKTLYNTSGFFIIFGSFILLFLISLLLAARFLPTHHKVVVVEESQIRFDVLLNQKTAKNVTVKFITVPLNNIEKVYSYHWDTEKSFGRLLGSNPRGEILGWDLIELNLKNDEGSYLINTLFMSRKNQRLLLARLDPFLPK